MKMPTKMAIGPTGIERQVAARPPKPGPRPNKKRGAPIHLNPPAAQSLSPNALAVKKSRARNPDKYRDYQRDYMRKRRAAKAPPC